MKRLIIVVIVVVGGAFLFFQTQRTTVEKSDAVDTVSVAQPPVTSTETPSEIFISSPANPFWQALLTEYKNYLHHSLEKNQAPGVAVAVVKDSSILYLDGMGHRYALSGDSIDTHSIFRLGSVSKSFAGVLTGILVQENILRWDDKVIKYVPSFRLKSKAFTDSLTIAHLLSHTTGLPYHAYTDRVDDGANFDTLVYHLRDLDLIGPPGKVYSYQNVAFSVISKVIESATGKSYEQVMKEKLFDPLHMGQSSLNFETFVNSVDHARPHRYARKGGWRPQLVSQTYYNVGPAGGVNSSISDMAVWLRALTNPSDTLLAPETKDAIFRPAVKAIARNRNFRKWKRSKGSYYALGWRVLTFKDDTLNYHGGYVNGFRSEVAIKRNDHLGICVLVNSAGPLADHAVPEFFRMYERYRKEIRAWDEAHTKPMIAQNP